MSDKDTITIDMTPTWSALLPVMLEAYANMKRKREANGCDGQFEGWCTVHDFGYYEDSARPGSPCKFYRLPGVEQGLYHKKLAQDFHDLAGQFAKMAKAADKYNESVNAHD